MKRCTLETNGFTVLFELEPSPYSELSQRYCALTTTFEIVRELGNVSAQSIRTHTTKQELSALCTYLERHMAALFSNPEYVSEGYITLETGLQLQAFEGDMQEEEDAGFTIRIMVNVGRAVPGDADLYLGGETFITSQQVRRFIANLRQSLTEI